MARRLLTVADLVSEVRSLLDEDNTDTVDTEADILPALNRGQDLALEYLAIHYEEPFLVEYELNFVAGQKDYDIPEDAFSDRIQKVDIRVTSSRSHHDLKPLSYSDLSDYESGFPSVNIPSYYTIIGRKMRITPPPSGAFDARVFFVRAPDRLVLPQGRITSTSVANNSLTLDAVGGDVGTDTDTLSAFVNIVDGQTGEIKQTLQVGKQTNDNGLMFKTADRTPVLNRTVSNVLSDQVEPDDYVCNIVGTCVLYFDRPLRNLILYHALIDLSQKLGLPTETYMVRLKEYEQRVKGTWAGRQNTLRIKQKSLRWGSNKRTYRFPGTIN